MSVPTYVFLGVLLGAQAREQMTTAACGEGVYPQLTTKLQTATAGSTMRV